jgi:hypothetical protein
LPGTSDKDASLNIDAIKNHAAFIWSVADLLRAAAVRDATSGPIMGGL